MKQSGNHTDPETSGATSVTDSIGSNKVFFQPKLTVSQPGDPYEQEADAVAAQVMRMAAPEAGDTPFLASKPVVIQRKCQACEEEERKERQQARPAVQRKCAECEREEATHVHRKAKNAHIPETGADFEQYVAGLPGSGFPLSMAERQFFEPRLHRDLSAVRIHTGAAAAQSAQHIHAKAYTVGPDIVFNTNQYQPRSHSGRQLIAHELVHTIQQGAIQSTPSIPTVQRQDSDSEVGVIESTSIDVLNHVLPVGFGFSFEIEGGVTWGYPVYTGGSIIVYVTRQSEERVHLRVRKQGRLALDTGAGGSIMFGTGSRRDGSRRGWGVGAEAGVNAMAGVQGTFIEEYSIPVTDFLGFVGLEVLDTLVSASSLGVPLSLILENHGSEYLIQHRIEGGIFANANAEASAGIRRPTEHFGEADGPRLGGAAWGPNDDRNFQGSRPDILQRDPMALLNFLSIFAGANVNAALTVGYDQGTDGDTTTTSLFIEGQFGLMLGLPIPVISDALANFPQDAGGGVELRIVQEGAGDPQVFAVVYFKQGEDQYYAGSAGQQEMVVNLTGVLSWQDLFDALVSGQLPPISVPSFSDMLEKVSFFQRLSLQSPNFARFSALLRRQLGTRSLLSTSVMAKAQRVYGVELNVYLDFGADIAGPDFIAIALQILEASRGAIDSLESAEDLSTAYEALSGYFSGYVQSEAFDELSDQILNTTIVKTAKLRLEIGVGVGLAARVAEGAKARFDLSGQVGISCELDLIQLLGSNISLATLIPQVTAVLDDPTAYLPDCPIIRELYNQHGDGSGGLGQSGGDAASGTTTPSPEGAGGSAPERSGSSSAAAESAAASSTTPAGYEVSRDYPAGAPPLEFPIREVRGISMDAPVGTQHEIRIQVAVPPSHTTTFWVTVQVRVVEVSAGRLEVEVTQPWWIPSIPMGSDTGHRYTFEYNH